MALLIFFYRPVILQLLTPLFKQLHIQQYDRRQISGQMFSSGYTESHYVHNRIARFLYTALAI